MPMPRPSLQVLAPLALAALLLTACETVVDVPPPPHTPQLVAHGFFTPDSLWVVRVSHSVPYTSAQAPGFVEDAAVEVWAGDRLVARPTRADTGTYVATGAGAVPGETYTLRVAAPGYAPVEGHDVLPPPPPMTAFAEIPIQEADSTSRRRRTRVEITLDDPPGPGQHYGILVVQARWRLDRRTGQVTPLPPSLFPFESDDPALGESAFDFLDTDKTLYREAFFTDGLFDGAAYTLDFEIQYDVPRPDAEVAVERVFAVLLLSVSDDFYRYWKTAGRQAFTNENPFAEPLRVHSNLTGGFGVFAGFQYRVLPLQTALPVPEPAFDAACRILGGYLPVCGAIPARP